MKELNYLITQKFLVKDQKLDRSDYKVTLNLFNY